MKIGIITMHRVRNIGSVCQSYATLKAFEKLGHEAELIDYVYTSSQKVTIRGLLAKVRSFVLNILLGFPQQKFYFRLAAFCKRYYRVSKESYNRDTINKLPRVYDIYCTGSDQVWNPRYIENDTTFMLDFLPDSCKRISYASSFATDSIPLSYQPRYAECLGRYDAISVREQTGLTLVKQLTAKDASLVCDPTLLLTAEEWKEVGKASATHIRQPYILVYFLGYMFDPRPHLYDIVADVQNKLNLPVYYLNGGYNEAKQRHSTVLRGQGPSEFVELIRNATFIVTDSFHGTAFASIFNVPMIGVVKDMSSGDDRIGSFRRIVDGAHSLLQYDDYKRDFDAAKINLYRCSDLQVKQFRNKSLNILKEMTGV